MSLRNLAKVQSEKVVCYWLADSVSCRSLFKRVQTMVICCCRMSLDGSCPYGERCTQAHSEAELEEWKEYFKQWRARLQSQTDRQDDCQFAEQLMEKWMNAEHPESIVSY